MQAEQHDEHWPRLRELFDEALARPPEQREAWLAGLGLDDGLGAELRSLLDAHHSAASFEVEGLPSVSGVFGLDGPKPGDRIGGYQLVERIGKGGMGEVFRAHQPGIDRDVAIKLMRTPFPSRRELRHFELEARVLARLSHPTIAHVYEAGVIEAGERLLPWYAMELVEGGQTLREWARARPSTRRRLALFLDICAGVERAHQRGILHRDLKPHNVLVDADGHAKLIDFGVAKLLGARIDEALATAPGQVLGTLAYMSPEQAAGAIARLDARSDQYSLGVLLFELLCGSLPFQLAGLEPAAAVRVIAEQPPALAELARAGISTDLQRVVGKALSSAPEQRYPSVTALAEDIRRVLAREPIMAREHSPGYVASRFVARNPALVGLFGVVLVSLSLGAGGLAVGWQRARGAADIAERARRRAEQAERDADWARELMVELLATGDPEREAVAQALLASADRLAAAQPAEPELAASVRLQLELGQLATRELEARAVWQVRRAELGAHHPATLDALWRLIELLLADAQLDHAVALFPELLDGAEAVLGPDSPVVARGRAKLADAEARLRERAAASPR